MAEVAIAPRNVASWRERAMGHAEPLAVGHGRKGHVGVPGWKTCPERRSGRRDEEERRGTRRFSARSGARADPPADAEVVDEPGARERRKPQQ
jgi:hypothetical protein